MERNPISRPFPSSPDEVTAAVERAPERVTDPECPYDPNDAGSVAAFWSRASVRRPGQRGPGKKAPKVLLTLRFSPEVVDYFRASGEGWQTRMNEVLEDWVSSRKSA